MSAFICNDRHINALVTYAQDQRVSLYLGGESGNSRRLEAADRNDAQTLAELLLRENERSIDHRYQQTTDPAPIVFRRERRPMAPIEILKMCACYDYQACETKDYEKTFAAQFIRNIRSAAISKLPGYDDGPWEFVPGYEEKHRAER